ncbi:MAG: hypothetical protein M1814_005300 [Vezdaea aestivalis]|nr:MAG: hypothetical protein M1814_005300 [Vezdaea aestivalis]
MSALPPYGEHGQPALPPASPQSEKGPSIAQGLEVAQPPAGLQVATPAEFDGLQVVSDPRHGDLEVGKPPSNVRIGGGQTQMSENPPRHRICGIRRRAFWSTVVLAMLIVLGAAIGGGVAGSRPQSKVSQTIQTASNGVGSIKTTSTPSPSPTPTPTTTSTSSSAYSGPTSGILSLNCPAINNTNYSYTPPGSNKAVSFTQFCNRDLTEAPGSPYTNLIGAVKTYTVELCMNACAQFNLQKKQKCVGVTWGGNLTEFPNTNCFYKNYTGHVSGYGGPQAAATML